MIILMILVSLKMFAQTNAKATTLNLEIKGMTCGGCVKMVQTSLKKIDGVAAINIDLENATGVIQYDASKVKEEAIVGAIEKAGGTRHSFKAQIVTASENNEKNVPDCCKPAKQKQDSPDCCAPSKGN